MAMIKAETTPPLSARNSRTICCGIAPLLNETRHRVFQCQHGNAGRGERDGLCCGQNGAVEFPVTDDIDDCHRQGREGIGCHRDRDNFAVARDPMFIDHVKHYAGQGEVRKQKHPAARTVARQLLPHLFAGGVAQRMPYKRTAHGCKRRIVSCQRIEPRRPVINGKSKLQSRVSAVPQHTAADSDVHPQPRVIAPELEVILFSRFEVPMLRATFGDPYTDDHQRVERQHIGADPDGAGFFQPQHGIHQRSRSDGSQDDQKTAAGGNRSAFPILFQFILCPPYLHGKGASNAHRAFYGNFPLENVDHASTRASPSPLPCVAWDMSP